MTGVVMGHLGAGSALQLMEEVVPSALPLCYQNLSNQTKPNKKEKAT